MNSGCSLSCKITRGNFQCPVLPAARVTEVPTFNIVLPMELISAPLLLDYTPAFGYAANPRMHITVNITRITKIRF